MRNLGSCKLTGGDANRVFGDPSSVGGSTAISVVLRAIVLRHDGADDSQEALRAKTRVTSNRVSDKSDMLSLFGGNSAISVAYTNREDLFRESFDGCAGWVELDRERHPAVIYTSQIAPTRIFINEGERRIVSLVSKPLSSLWVQALIGSTPAVLKWYFPSAKDITEDEIAFFRSVGLRKGSEQESDEQLSSVITAFADRVADETGFIEKSRSLFIRGSLSNYFNRTRDRRIKGLENTMDDVSREIDNYTCRLSGLYADLDRIRTDLCGLKMVKNASSESIIKFFEEHKQITLISYDEDSGDIIYGVDETLEFFDDDEVEDVIDNDGSFLYECGDTTIDVFKAIFRGKKGVFRVNTEFKLSVGSLVHPMQYVSFIEDAMPQPHLYFYGCSGGNDKYYAEFAKRGEWDMAIEQSIAATKNINFGDVTVSEKMMEWIEDHQNVKCIYINDGSLVSIREFADKLQKGEL